MKIEGVRVVPKRLKVGARAKEPYSNTGEPVVPVLECLTTSHPLRQLQFTVSIVPQQFDITISNHESAKG